MGHEIPKGKKYWEGVPVSDIGILWVGKKFCIYIFCSKKIFFAYYIFSEKFFEIFSWVSVGIEVVVLLS